VISVHQYAPQDYLPLFARIEPILRKHGGRPHWGQVKMPDDSERAQISEREARRMVRWIMKQ
ncbi:MAG: hypothetical protein RIS48_1610, partial [Pseudomonadota bacterium]